MVKRVRGLWMRKGTYYARLDANNGKQYKYPLHGAETVPQAITETQVLKKLKRDGKLLPPTEMRLGKKEDKKESTDGHLLTEAIAEAMGSTPQAFPHAARTRPLSSAKP